MPWNRWTSTLCAQAVRDCNVFARVRPDQKLRLVEALKANGEVVAMTGDGVNDAPALKAAHIGIAMGARGSDVAREAAALVLADDDFPAIVSAVRLGRRIYDNLAKAVRFVFAAHVPIAGLSVLPVIFDWPILLMPLHIVFIELIIDPACSMAFEAEPAEPGIMLRRPRAADARLFDRSTVFIGLLQGVGLFVAVLATFLFSMRSGHTSEDARTIAFTTLVFGNVVLIWANRSAIKTVLETGENRNPALWLVTLRNHFNPSGGSVRSLPEDTFSVLRSAPEGSGPGAGIGIHKHHLVRSAEADAAP